MKKKYQLRNEDWFRVKSYLHFDSPIKKKDRPIVEKDIFNPDWVAKYSFYPFINFHQKKYKTVETQEGKRVQDKESTRPLSYAAHLDSLIYSYYNVQLSEKYENILKENSLDQTVIAFRKLKDEDNNPKCNIHFANDAFEAIKSIGQCKVIVADIKSFFDKLNPEILKKSWAKILGLEKLPNDHFAIYKSLSNHSIVDRDELYKKLEISKRQPFKNDSRICSPENFRNKVRGSEASFNSDGKKFKGLIEIKTEGIPQGSPLSATLANIYMLDFDIEMSIYAKNKNGKYFRYYDDIFIIVPDYDDKETKEKLEIEIKKVKLTLHPDKYDEVRFFIENDLLISEKPLQYLGFLFDGQRKYLRPSSLSRYQRRVKKYLDIAENAVKKHNTIREKNNQPIHNMYKKKLYRMFFHTSKSNFIIYGQNAAEIMDSETIKNQMKRMKKFLIEEIQKRGINKSSPVIQSGEDL